MFNHTCHVQPHLAPTATTVTSNHTCHGQSHLPRSVTPATVSHTWPLTAVHHLPLSPRERNPTHLLVQLGEEFSCLLHGEAQVNARLLHAGERDAPVGVLVQLVEDHQRLAARRAEDTGRAPTLPGRSSATLRGVAARLAGRLLGEPGRALPLAVASGTVLSAAGTGAQLAAAAGPCTGGVAGRVAPP
eukprot:366517-Chlamydomonas_euryale.AAC.21